MTDYRALLRPLFDGRRILLAGGPVQGHAGKVAELRALGAERCLVVGSVGAGPPPAEADAECVYVDVIADDMVDEFRRWEAIFAEPPPHVRDAADAYDPDLVLLQNFDAATAFDGRPAFGPRRPEWTALEDKTTVDAFWDEAGVARAPSAVVPVDRTALRDAAAELDRGDGTVWAGDASHGFNGGAVLVHWVRDDATADAALTAFDGRCERARVAPFLEGLPCSIHGFVTGTGVAVFRPVELVVLRATTPPLFRYAGASTTWDPPPADREAMRDVARRVGEMLHRKVDFRGGFTVDGIHTADGFLPTELNPRLGAGLRYALSLPLGPAAARHRRRRPRRRPGRARSARPRGRRRHPRGSRLARRRRRAHRAHGRRRRGAGRRRPDRDRQLRPRRDRRGDGAGRHADLAPRRRRAHRRRLRTPGGGPVPVTGVSLGYWQDAPPLEALDTARLADELGYPELWLGEMATFDAFTLATAVGVSASSLTLTIGPLAVAVRDPAMLAMGAASVAALTGRPVGLAIGTSSPVVVGGWHGRDPSAGVRRLREAAIALSLLFAGDRAPGGYRLRLPAPRSPLTIAAFGPAAVRVAAEHGDRMVVNICTPAATARLREELEEASAAAGRPAPPLAAWVPAAVDPDDAAIDQLRRGLVPYVAAPGYGEMFAEAGYGDIVALARSGARPADVLAAVPRELVASIAAVGDADTCRAFLDRYPADVAVVPATAGDPGGRRTLSALAPAP